MTGPHIAWLCGLVVFALVTLLPVPACAVPDAEDAVDIRTAVQRALPQLGASCNRWQKVRASYVQQLQRALGEVGSLSFAQADALRALLPTLGTGFDPQVAQDAARGMPLHWGERNTVYQRAWLWFWFRTRSAPLRTVLLCVMRVRIGNRSGGLWQYVLLAGYTHQRQWVAPPLAVFNSADVDGHTYDNDQARFAWADGAIVYTDRTNNTTVRVTGVGYNDLADATANGRGACLGGRCVGGAGSVYWSRQWDNVTVQFPGGQAERAIGWLDWQSTDSRTTIPLVRMLASINDSTPKPYIWLAARFDTDSARTFSRGWYMLFGNLPPKFDVGTSFSLYRLRYGGARVAAADTVVASVTQNTDRLPEGQRAAVPLPSQLRVGDVVVETDAGAILEAVHHESGDASRWHVCAGTTWRLFADRGAVVGSGLLEYNNFEGADALRETAQRQLDEAQLPRVPRDAYPPSKALVVGGAAAVLAATAIRSGASMLLRHIG